MMSFGEITGLKDKVKIVVNRVGLDASQISLKKAQETIGREIFWQLPNDYRTMSEVRNNGVPLIEAGAQGCDYAIDLSNWPNISARAGTDEDGRGRGLAKRAKSSRWSNLFGGKK